MCMKLSERVNEGGSLVVIIDERGAQCLDFIPGSVKRGNYLIKNQGNGVVICKKVFCQTNKIEMVMIGDDQGEPVGIATANFLPSQDSVRGDYVHASIIGECKSFSGFGSSVNCVGMKREVSLYDQRETLRNDMESRSHSRSKPQYPRQDEVRHFNLARHAEDLVAPKVHDMQ